MTATVSEPMTIAMAARVRRCPLCDAASGQPCQAKPAADHLGRYLDSWTAGQLSRAYMERAVSELVVIHHHALVGAS
jgi:hypothetical protein